MAFTARDVKDMVVQYPNRFLIDGVSHTIEPNFGTVTDAGTSINKAYLQPIEDELGILAVHGVASGSFTPNGTVRTIDMGVAAKFAILVGAPQYVYSSNNYYDLTLVTAAGSINPTNSAAKTDEAAWFRIPASSSGAYLDGNNLCLSTSGPNRTQGTAGTVYWYAFY